MSVPQGVQGSLCWGRGRGSLYHLKMGLSFLLFTGPPFPCQEILEFFLFQADLSDWLRWVSAKMSASVFVSVLVCFCECLMAYVSAFIHVCVFQHVEEWVGLYGSLCVREWLGVCMSVFHDSMIMCFNVCVGVATVLCMSACPHVYSVVQEPTGLRRVTVLSTWGPL